MIIEQKGDITKCDAQYIAHQCNCLSRGSAGGVAHTIFSKFPWSDCYRDRQEDSVMGELDVRGNGNDERFVINMFSQHCPGGIRFEDSKTDGRDAREDAFKSCLMKIRDMEDIESIAFPARIGCAIAGGDWVQYHWFISRLDASWKNLGQERKVYIIDYNG